MAAYSFTSKDIATALVAAQRRGVEVGIVVDEKEKRDIQLCLPGGFGPDRKLSAAASGSPS